MLLSSDKYAGACQIAELMASKVFLSTGGSPLIIQSPVLPNYCDILQYLQCAYALETWGVVQCATEPPQLERAEAFFFFKGSPFS